MSLKNITIAVLSAIGGYVVSFLGGVDVVLKALIVFMSVDYLTGLAVAFVFHKSSKTEGGGASSKEGFKGIVKKVCMLLLVGLAHELDMIMGADYIRAITIMFFLANEGLSVLENVGLMGVGYPAFLIKALEVLKENTKTSGTEMREEIEVIPYETNTPLEGITIGSAIEVLAKKAINANENKKDITADSAIHEFQKIAKEIDESGDEE